MHMHTLSLSTTASAVSAPLCTPLGRVRRRVAASPGPPAPPRSTAVMPLRLGTSEEPGRLPRIPSAESMAAMNHCKQPQCHQHVRKEKGPCEWMTFGSHRERAQAGRWGTHVFQEKQDNKGANHHQCKPHSRGYHHKLVPSRPTITPCHYLVLYLGSVCRWCSKGATHQCNLRVTQW